jgi:hypothetical protein
MKKNILVFGGISGLVVGILSMILLLFSKATGDHGSTSLFLGYLVMVIAFSFIFVGVKNFRDKYNEGVISFGKAFTVGLGITLVASTIYVLFWLVDFYVFIPDFMDKYAAAQIKRVTESGVSQAVLDKKIADINDMKTAYKNPVFVVLYTYAEILPVGIVISLLTAFIQKRRRPKVGVPVAG